MGYESKKNLRIRAERAEAEAGGLKVALRKAGLSFHGATSWGSPRNAWAEFVIKGNPNERDIRRETLRTVIEALEIAGYRQSDYTIGDIAADRFWEDIQTALEVRKEAKNKADREATEKKVAALTKNPFTASFTFVPAPDLDDPSKPTLEDLLRYKSVFVDEKPTKTELSDFDKGLLDDIRDSVKPRKKKRKPTETEGDCE